MTGNFERLRFELRKLFSIRVRVALLALILVVPLMADRVRVLEASRTGEFHAHLANLAFVAEHNVEAQRQMVKSLDALLRSTAYIYAFAAKEGRGCAVLRSSISFELPWIMSLNIVGQDGKIECSTQPNYVGLNVGDRPYYQRVRETYDFVLSDFVLGRATGQPLVMAAYPAGALLAGDERVILASVNIGWMAGILSSIKQHPGVEGFLIDSKGTVLASSPLQPSLHGMTLKDHGLPKILVMGETGKLTSMSDDGRKHQLLAARISGTGARLVMRVDEGVMLAGIDNDIRKAYLQLAVVGLLVLLGAWFVSEQFLVRPLRTLTRIAKRLGGGDLHIRAADAALPAEFGPLAKAFNTMATQLAAREEELVASNNRLAVMATIDVVSGLANRRGFESRLDFEWTKAEFIDSHLALIMVDIDHFKLFNDTYGHPAGDACLRLLGEAMAGVSLEVSAFAARYGGEEFCLVLQDAGPEHAAQIAENVRGAIARLEIPHAQSPVGSVTASVGWAMARPASGQKPAELIEAADAALYAAKRRGRNTVVGHGLGKGRDPLAMAG